MGSGRTPIVESVQTRYRATVAGMLTMFTGSEMDVIVDGRSITSDVTISGPLMGTSPAIPVEVTIYGGRVIHVEGEAHLRVDTDAAPSTKCWNDRNFGPSFLALGAVAGIYSGVKAAQAATTDA